MCYRVCYSSYWDDKRVLVVEDFDESSFGGEEYFRQRV